jgi:hypothetical protein
MLWSDPENKPPAELRAAQAMLRRMAWVLAVAAVIAAALAVQAR